MAARSAGRDASSLRTRLLIIGVTGVAVALLLAGVGFYQALTVSTDRTLDREALSSAHEVAALVDEGRLPEAVPTSGAQLVQVVDAQQRVIAASLGADRLVPVLTPAQLQRGARRGGRAGRRGPHRVVRAAAGPGRSRPARADAPVAVIVAVQVGDVLAARTALRTGLLVVFPVVLLVHGRRRLGGHGPHAAPGRAAARRRRADRRRPGPARPSRTPGCPSRRRPTRSARSPSP